MAEREKPGGVESPSFLATVEPESRSRPRRHSPSAARNEADIRAVLAPRLPARGSALEIASGTGLHAAGFAQAFGSILWTPSDPDPVARESIRAWREQVNAPNLGEPLDLDVTREGWEAAAGGPFGAVVAINMVHIAPWEAWLGLLRGAARLLRPEGMLCLYGCFSREGRHLTQANADFDAMLREQNPAWGVRDVVTVAAEAATQGLPLRETVEMPKDNLFLVFRMP